MNILVLMKEVPDMERVRFDPERGVVDRSSAAGEINPFDRHALEAAVELKERTGGHVTVMTMGPPGAEKSLRDAWARGADQMILLTDRKFGGADTCATAQTLAAAIRMLGGFHLILCGEKSVDGDTAQVGAEVAQFLEIPHAYYVEEITRLDEKQAEVTVESLWGSPQKRVMRLPALAAVTKNINRPRLPSVNRKLASLNESPEVISLERLKGFLNQSDTGFAGSPTKVSGIEIPQKIQRSSKLFREEGEFPSFAAAVKEKLEAAGLRTWEHRDEKDLRFCKRMEGAKLQNREKMEVEDLGSCDNRKEEKYSEVQK